MKKILKKFPLTAYSVVVILMLFFTDKNIQYDSDFIHMIVLWILVMPLMVINQLHMMFDIQSDVLPWVFPIFFCLLLDLLILSLRTGSLKNFLKKTYHKLTKPKK